jgi:predicted phage-related endonuclease
MLTSEQIAARQGKLTASRVACLMTGNTAKIMDLYLEMTDDQSFVPENLDNVWAVQLGACTEKLSLDWYDGKHNRVTRRGEVVVHPYYTWAAATLDGWDDVLECPIECKHVGGREPMEVIVDRYQPQMHWQMICTNTQQCALSVIMGAAEPIIEYVPRDREYSNELIARGLQFMDHVRRRVPPVEIAPVPPPADASKIYDMTSNNLWASQAADWLANQQAGKTAEAAAKALKEITPRDAKKATGHGVRITRDRASRLSLRVDDGA